MSYFVDINDLSRFDVVACSINGKLVEAIVKKKICSGTENNDAEGLQLYILSEITEGRRADKNSTAFVFSEEEDLLQAGLDPEHGCSAELNYIHAYFEAEEG